jgi:hypothetical protein
MTCKCDYESISWPRFQDHYYYICFLPTYVSYTNSRICGTPLVAHASNMQMGREDRPGRVNAREIDIMAARKLAIVDANINGSVNGMMDAPKVSARSQGNRATASKQSINHSHAHGWSHAGVTLCVGASAWLNGYANAMHAPNIIPAWGLGIMIPCLVFILCKVAAKQHRKNACIKVRGRKIMLAAITACVGGCLLALSVHHCACSLAVMTGSPLMLAYMFAIAIDCGLVVCEIDIVLG